jgi:hypothetical protein
MAGARAAPRARPSARSHPATELGWARYWLGDVVPRFAGAHHEGMWGTFLLDVYRQGEAADVRDALERILGPDSGSGWATGGVYVFWNPDTREPLYVGIAGDFPERFAQHNGLRACPARGCKREQIERYFANEGESLGYTVLTLSSLSQPSTHRQRKSLGLTDRDLIELNEALSGEVLDEVRALEGRMIALHERQFGRPIRWNVSPGRLPRASPSSEDGTLATAVGIFDCLLQARRTIRQLADDPEAMMFEEFLHGVRLTAVGAAIVGRRGFRNDLLRRHLERSWAVPLIRDEILKSAYLNHRNPLTIGPLLDAPEDDR